MGVEARTLLAALCVAKVEVARAPRLALLCTGRELVDDLHEPLRPGQIRSSNATWLWQRCVEAGAVCVHNETLGNELELFLSGLRRALDSGVEIVLGAGAKSTMRPPDADRAASMSLGTLAHPCRPSSARIEPFKHAHHRHRHACASILAPPDRLSPRVRE